MKATFPYRNIYEYLNEVLPTNAEEGEIMQARKIYLKKYNAHIQRKIRARKTILHLKIDKAEAKVLQQKAAECGCSLFMYIKSAALNNQPLQLLKKRKLYELEAEVLDLLESLRELKDNRRLIRQAESIDQHIQSLIKSIES